MKSNKELAQGAGEPVGCVWRQSGEEGHPLLTGEPAYTAESVAQAVAAAVAQYKADAERYRFIRDTPWDEPLASVISQQRNAIWDSSIDAAMSAGGGQ